MVVAQPPASCQTPEKRAATLPICFCLCPCPCLRLIFLFAAAAAEPELSVTTATVACASQASPIVSPILWPLLIHNVEFYTWCERPGSLCGCLPPWICHNPNGPSSQDKGNDRDECQLGSEVPALVGVDGVEHQPPLLRNTGLFLW